MIEITPLSDTDRQAWQPLAVGYNAFYERVLPDADYDRTWRRLMKGEATHGLAARLDGRLVGIAHYMFQTSIWFDDVCYLADLFVDETVRGQGAARALIEVTIGSPSRTTRAPESSTTRSRASRVSSATTIRWHRHQAPTTLRRASTVVSGSGR